MAPMLTDMLASVLRPLTRHHRLRHFGSVEPTRPSWQMLIGCAYRYQVWDGTKCLVQRHSHLGNRRQAFALQYRRVFPLSSFRRLCDAMIVFSLLFGISQIVISSLQCIPFAHTPISLQRGSGGCIHTMAWWLANAAINLAKDVVILVMPMPHLKRLPLPPKQRIVLMAIFGLGILYDPFPLFLLPPFLWGGRTTMLTRPSTCAISIIRIDSLVRANKSENVTYHYAISALWANVELCCAIICVCTPTLRPLVYTARSRLSSMHFRLSWPKRLLSATTTNTALSDLTLKKDAADREQPPPSQQPQREAAEEAGGEEGTDGHYPPWTSCIPDEAAGTDVEASPEQIGLGISQPPPVARYDSFRSGVTRRTHDPSTGLWTADNPGDSDDDLDLEIDLHGDELPTLLCPPPRSHAQRSSTPTSVGGKGGGAAVGLADSPILKGVDPKGPSAG
ncbi:hypothetical protein ACRALDRAFT_2026655 [Sodiomyces alcalophilus JCM 7366]|uniref:uncharacterized protein n=1 Tax=Sodiomyces alcalophilus JCM 7366 TaxID=591952 RepID=UPI0039B64976